MNAELSYTLGRICDATERLRAELDHGPRAEAVDLQLYAAAGELITLGRFWSRHLARPLDASACPRAERVLDWMDLVNLTGDLIVARVCQVCRGHA